MKRGQKRVICKTIALLERSNASRWDLAGHLQQDLCNALFKFNGEQLYMSAISYRWDLSSEKNIVTLHIRNNPCILQVEDWGEGVIRLLLQKNPCERRPPFLMGSGTKVAPSESDNRLIFEAGISRLIFSGKGGWTWEYKGKPLLREADDHYIRFDGPRALAPPLNLGKDTADFSIALDADEPIYGGGETFGYLNKRRQKLDLRIIDPCGLTHTNYSYKNIPLFWSPRGWGIFCCTDYPITADIGCTSHVSMNLRSHEPELDIFLIPGKPNDVMRHYWRLTGMPMQPPEWGLGIWWSRCMYENAEQVFEIVERLEKENIGGSVISLDPLWLKNKNKWGWDSCDFQWNEADFGEMKEFCRRLHEKGYKLCLWENPYLWLEGKGLEYFSDFLMKDDSGKPLNIEPPLGGRGIVERMEMVGIWDLTNKAAWDKRKELLSELLENGADTFKADYGEGMPGDAMHNTYAFLYLKNSWEAVAEVRGKENAMIWARPGWSGCQRYPGMWAGDSQSTFASMGATLAGCLSAAASGYSWWSHDIGGFHHYAEAPPSPELYIRWAEWGMLSPLARFHGTTPREPWHFGEKAVEAVRNLAVLRRKLIPGILSDFNKLTPEGFPLARPLVMDYPDDPNTYNLSTQYMLGASLIIAPILRPGISERRVYLPEGAWRRYGRDDYPIRKGPAWISADSPPGNPIIFEKLKG